jgi:hypothetical protein
MSDTTPDPTGDENASPNPRARRAGLDRLRAARGSAGAEGPTATSSSGTAAAESPAGTAGGGRRSGGATTLLDTPSEPEPTADTSVTEEPGASDDRADKSSQRKKKLGRADAAVAAAGTADEAGADKAGTAGALGSRRLRRSGPAAAAGATGAAFRPADQRQRVLAVALAVLVIALLIPVIAMRHRIVGQSKEDKAITSLVDKQTEALSEARRFSVTFFSPDYKTIDQYSDQVAAQSTGTFNQDFVSKRAELKSLLTKVQSQASGRVLAAGVSKVSGNDAEVLVVADQDVKNTTSQGKTVTNRYRVRVSLQKTPKGWLVSNLEPVV